MARIISGGVTAPVGLLGDTRTNMRVLGVIRASISPTSRAKSSRSQVGTGTGVPPQRRTAVS
jgi:hypothetical protein